MPSQATAPDAREPSPATGRFLSSRIGRLLHRYGHRGLIWLRQNPTTVKRSAYVALAVLLGHWVANLTTEQAVLAGLVLILFVLRRQPLAALALLVVLLPFTQTDFFARSLLDFPGAKALNLLGAGVALLAVLNYRNATLPPRHAMVFLALYFLLFSVSIGRALPRLQFIEVVLTEHLDAFRFVLSYFIKPLVYFLPFLVLLFYGADRTNWYRGVRAATWGINVLSCYLLYVFFVGLGGAFSVRDTYAYYSDVLGLHRNDLANFYILGIPLLMGRFFARPGPLRLASLALALTTVAFVYSRTAYLTVALALIAYLVLSKRKRYLPLVAIGAIALLATFGTVTERVTTGFGSGDTDALLAGRLVHIWQPLLHDLAASPSFFLFGHGRLGIASSAAMQQKAMLEVSHPHNMYLEQILDTGLIGLAVVVALFIPVVGGCIRVYRRSRGTPIHDYACALLVAIGSYFMAGLSGRSLFPNVSNSLFWLTIALAIWLPTVAFDSDEKPIDLLR